MRRLKSITRAIDPTFVPFSVELTR
jgi:hypothetical protein